MVVGTHPMRSPDGSYIKIDRHLTLTLALLIGLILGGNGLVILQFERARLRNDRLTGVSHQLIAVLRLQDSLLLFHQGLVELARSRNAHRLAVETGPLRTALVKQTQQTRSTLASLPSEVRVDPGFLAALDAIETTLPSHLQEIAALANLGDWEAIRLRVDNELKQMEAATSALVASIDRDLDEELPLAVADMTNVHRRILLIVPVTALSTVLVAAFIGWAIARRILELRLEERVSERTRIARELHDTLLQSFQGVLLKLQVVTYQLEDRPEARKTLEIVIAQARQAVNEGRDAVQGLRASTVVTNDLARAIETLGQELASEQAGQNPEFRVHVEGTSRDLAPIVREDVHRIAYEALRNAFRHAQATRIEVKIQYDKRRLRLRVRDDGKGIDPQILREGGRAGHHGMPGLHERAKLVGGKLAIWSEPESGTEIELSIPASVAYGKLPVPRAIGSG